MAERRQMMAMRTAAWLSGDAHPYIKGNVLDVGAGDAPYKRLFAPLVESWTTLDARPVADVLGDMDDFESEMPFDTVLCTDALQFSRDPRRAVANMADCLAVGGHLILSAPNCWFEDAISRWRFTLGGMGELIESAGLKVVSLDGLTGLFQSEAENCHLIGEYTSQVPATFQGFINSLDRIYPMATAVIAVKE